MQKFRNVLLASDFDNTLVYTQGALERGEDIPPMSARNREAVDYFLANGGFFTVATGRALPAFAQFASALPVNAPCVIANGAAIYDFAGNRYVETAFLDADIYDHVDALLARFPRLCFEVYHDDRRIHVLHPNRFSRNHEHLTRAGTVEVGAFREVDLPVIKLLFEEEKPLLDEVYAFIRSQSWGERYELIFSSDHLLELTRRGATKGGMILKLAALLGVARRDIYCIGDHNNDIPMLKVSEIGFAPENATDEVKASGARIVCHCRDGALADVVDILDKRY
ncbi:MAG: HAD-IIB family hydrolase [Oscillospiraceae bacterium]|nr:HAD-IIB family hydrolase [Oscillospiraceae bacterium]